MATLLNFLLYFNILAFILNPSLSFSEIINIPADIDSIQGGINLASDGDTVLVQPGTYIENINFSGKDIILGSLFLTTGDTSYISQTVIDGNKRNCVANFTPGSDSTTVFTGFTIMNGFGYMFDGGGIQIELSDPIVTHMKIINNVGGNGGGIKFENTRARFSNIIVKFNRTKEDIGTHGGGIYCVGNASPILTNVVVEDNFTYGSGGGIHIQQYCHPTLSNCHIIGNSAQKAGGGIYIEAYCDPTISNCIIIGNKSGNNGGGIFCENANPLFKDLKIEQNIAENAGGGIYFEYNNPGLGPEVEKINVIRNRARQGGGIYFENFAKSIFSKGVSNVYLNYAEEIGNDLYAKNLTTIEVNLDTFSVLKPGDIHAYPITTFSLNIYKSKIKQTITDLYVSPEGDDFNDGHSESSPLKTVNMAFTKILADSTKLINIFLKNGTYDAKILNTSFYLTNYKYVKLAVDWQSQMNIIGDKIYVFTTWWNTYWAWISYLLVFAGLFFSFRKYDRKRQLLKYKLEIEHLHTEKLEEVDQMKSKFFANISHEFRTPLTLILGPVKQMLSGDFVGNVKEQYRMIVRNGERLLQLINQLLDLSKLESGRMTLQVTKTDICEFLKVIVCSFSSLAESKTITLKFNPTDELNIGYIDRDKMEKIITNLLSNAFKFTPERGIIGVTVKIPNAKIQSPNKFQVPNSDFVQITVTNTGSQIPQEQLENIFDRFYQVDTTYKKDDEGTGIGLALTKELVELHHGTIEVDCRRGTMHRAPTTDDSFHTTFTIMLPIGKEHLSNDEIIEGSSSDVSDHTPQISHPTSHIPDPGSRIPDKSGSPFRSDPHRESSIQHPVYSILIVEDNPDVTTYICSFLKQDYEIITAGNGKEGLELTMKELPDLIISDVMMPEMDGFELCQKLKSDERTSHIPIILLTAKADRNSRIEGLEFGADDYISKPFEARELQVRTKNLIEQRQKLREKFSQSIEIKPGEVTATSLDEQFITRLLDVFEDHVAESDFSTEDFAREVGMSRSNLHRKLQALTNQPTHEFLRTLRLKRAAQLLRKSAGSVTDIAYAVGFNNLSHFTKIFHEHFGQTPSNFAKKSDN
jgi:signal transduction histidine kinase/DNA-binding response OmpR family regulator